MAEKSPIKNGGFGKISESALAVLRVSSKRRRHQRLQQLQLSQPLAFGGLGALGVGGVRGASIPRAALPRTSNTRMCSIMIHIISLFIMEQLTRVTTTKLPPFFPLYVNGTSFWNHVHIASGSSKNYHTMDEMYAGHQGVRIECSNPDFFRNIRGAIFKTTQKYSRECQEILLDSCQPRLPCQPGSPREVHLKTAHPERFC